MGAVVASIFVILVAVFGFIYFNHQDKVEARKHDRKQ